MTTSIHRRVDALREGKDPAFVARLASGWAVLGERQFLPGYCLLLPDPVVPTLNALTGAERAAFLADMASLGDAVLAVTHAVRINYAIYGNQDPALHAHVIPRFHDESPELSARAALGLRLGCRARLRRGPPSRPAGPHPRRTGKVAMSGGTRMIFVYSPLHARHDGGKELYRGEFVPTFETPARVDHILAALQAGRVRAGAAA